ncbi:MAG TPA: NUDIX hydrolase, partial [Longimicrobiaceae bacterium]
VEAALRELREETGYAGGEARLLGTLALNPSWQTTRVYVVLARGVERTEGKDLDDTEDTRVRLVPAERVRDLVVGGEVKACVAVAAFGLWAWSPEGAAG